jgi:tetratricopeptide (TPR) repeat protein
MNKRLIQSVAFALCIIWTGIAWGHGDLSRFPDSVQIEQYRLNIWLNPDDLETRNKLAMALFRSNKLGEAEEELRYVIDKDPQNFNGLDGLGIVLIKMKKHKEALGYLEEAAKINEMDVLLHVHLYVAYEKMNMDAKAQSELKKARALAAGTDEAELIDKEIDLIGGP